MNIALGSLSLTLDVGHVVLGALCLGLLLAMVLILLLDVVSLSRRLKGQSAAAPPPAAVPGVPPSAAATAARPEPSEGRGPAAAAAPASVAVEEGTEAGLHGATGTDAALQLLGILQKEARFVDFLHEDIAQYTDAEVGAAARLVHEGCRKVLKSHVTLEPIRKEDEDSEVSLPAGFNAAAIRLTGNVVGKPPFKGRLTHRGWRCTTIKLPKLAKGHDPRILTPAEIEM
jgi:hypothetical protein